MPSPSLLRRILDSIKNAYYAKHYGYPVQRDWIGFGLHPLAFILPGYRAQWDFSVFYLPAQAQGHLLDIGCGTGTMLKRMADLGWQVQGLDFAPKAVEVARSQGLNVRLGSLEEQCFDDESFDAVVMSHVIEHVVDPHALLANCKRILKPGGQLISITPNASSWGHQLYLRNWSNLDPPRHLHIFTPEAMEQIAKDVGFRQYEVITSVANAHWVLWSSKQLKEHGELNRANYTRRARLWARAMQIAEWMHLQRQPHFGEEIVLKASM